MSQSLYLKMAVAFVRLDLNREHRAWLKANRRVRVDFPHLNAHLLRDIGIESDSRVQMSRPPQEKATRTVRHLRRYLSSRRVT